jgi:murein DD-endopeptidase MepM/ murein hydrolase activator NlpD
MKKRATRRPPLAAVVLSFAAGVLVDSVLRTYGPPQPVDTPTLIAPAPTSDSPAATRDVPPLSSVGTAPSTPAPSPTIGRQPQDSPEHRLGTTGTSGFQLPIEGMNLEAVKDSFNERRGNRPHEAVDILAARNTPVHAVGSGSIAKLFVSREGGRTIYQFDSSGRFCYYYAHLERYAEGLHDGDAVAQGQVIGYVGTSGNAPPNTPHLHFAVFELGDDHKWWKGQAIDPYPLLKRKANG